MSFDRHYNAPIAGRWVMRCYAAAGAVILPVALLDDQGGTFGTVGVAVAAAALVLIFVRAEHAFPRYGLYESSEGLRDVTSFGSKTLAWDQIERFEQAKRRPRGRVLVVGKNGKVVRIVGTAQGARIVWSGGETRDVVGVLNERLLAWRSQRTGAT